MIVSNAPTINTSNVCSSVKPPCFFMRLSLNNEIIYKEK